MTEEQLKRGWLKQDEKVIDNALGVLLSHRDGRKFLWWWLEQTGVNRQPFAGNALQTAFNCGELNAGQRFLARIVSVSPDGYVSMMKENADERRQRDAELGKLRDERGNRDDGNYGDELRGDRAEGDLAGREGEE